MKAFRFYENGEPEVLRFEDVDVPQPGPGEIRIRQEAIAVNYRDIYLRRGQHAVRGFPSGMGIESAGTVEAIGADVSGLSIGDRVACVAGPDSAYAESRVVPAARAVRLPDDIDARSAAAMMVKGMTARYLLHETYRVKPGDAIVVHAAAGGVGLILCQWAKHLGAMVIGTVGSQQKVAVARAHGCDHVIDYTREDFAERVRAFTGGEGVPVVYDSVGKATFEGSLRCLRRRGVLASYGEASGDPDPVPPRRLGLLGSVFLTHPSLPDYIVSRAELLETANDLFAVVRSGTVRIAINHSYALKDAPQAQRDLEARKTTGSIVLIP